MRRLLLLGCAALGFIILTNPRSAPAQDLEYGPPWILKGGVESPGAVFTRHGTVALVETLAHRLRVAMIGPGELGLEPTWTVLSDVADRSAPDALAFPQGVALDVVGNLYVADTGHDAVKLYRRETAGGYTFDPAFESIGLPSEDPRPLSVPRDIAVGPDGRVYLLDAGNDRILVAPGPDARHWSLHRADPSWEDPSGIDVGPDGTVWLAEAGRHRIVAFLAEGGQREFGSYGAAGSALRRPHDVALSPTGAWVHVADTDNHRIAVFSPDGILHRSLGGAPLLAQPVRVHVDDRGRVFVTDSSNDSVVVWPGPQSVAAGLDSEARFDSFMRDRLDDAGEPSPEGLTMASPDILVRHAPDLDLGLAERETLASISEEIPVYDRSNYLYFEVRNRGTEAAVGGAVGVWTHRSGAGDAFPMDWERSGVRSESEDSPIVGSAEIAYVPAGGHAIIGPLVWRPDAPAGGGSCLDATRLMARIVELDDPMEPGEGLEQARLSNNVVVRRVPLVPERCVPAADRYERNDHIEGYAIPDEEWEHLAGRCPRIVTRALGRPYPDTECRGVFENGLAPRSAEEIWNLRVPDLSLHGTADRDFFRIPLPDLTDPRWGLNDIHPEEIRALSEGSGVYIPETMPECGAVQRHEFGPPGRDNTIWVNVSTELLITVMPTDGGTNALTDRTLGTDGEEIRVFRDGEPAPELATGGPLTKRLVCPQSASRIREVDLSFGERQLIDGSLNRRSLETLGGYELKLTYLASIERGFPEWVAEHNEGRGIRQILCLPGPFLPGPGGPPPQPGELPSGFVPDFGGFGVFPLCGEGLGRGPMLIFPSHPQTPGLQGCLADGPGCRELSRFRWEGRGRGLDLFFRAPVDLHIRLLGVDGKTLAVARETKGYPPWKSLDAPSEMQRWRIQRLRVQDLKAGDYFLQVDGPATEYAIEYDPRRQ